LIIIIKLFVLAISYNQSSIQKINNHTYSEFFYAATSRISKMILISKPCFTQLEASCSTVCYNRLTS